jgi:hypothetical protein
METYSYRDVTYYYCQVTGRYFSPALDEIFFTEDDIKDAINEIIEEALEDSFLNPHID